MAFRRRPKAKFFKSTLISVDLRQATSGIGHFPGNGAKIAGWRTLSLDLGQYSHWKAINSSQSYRFLGKIGRTERLTLSQSLEPPVISISEVPHPGKRLA